MTNQFSSIKINKEVCVHCAKRKTFGTIRDDLWERGILNCPMVSVGERFAFSAIRHEKGPSKECPYLIEHFVKQFSTNTDVG